MPLTTPLRRTIRGDTQLGAPADVLEDPAQDRGPRFVGRTVGTRDPDEAPFWPSMTAPARRSSVGNFCLVRIVPDKRYSPFAKQKVVPRGLDSIRACRSVPGRTCTRGRLRGAMRIARSIRWG
jgi:hypothetical protein